ncbi:SDR family oxidoreductase [Candidatus Cloacimonadota bacterium]
MKNILVVGATGYLGKFIIKELKKQDFWVRALVRNAAKLNDIKDQIDDIFLAEVTTPISLNDVCKDIDIVISALGITKQKDGLSYMDVDFQGNLNILTEAKKSGVSKFIYVSALDGDNLKNLKIFTAKELFVQKLQQSDLDYCVIRPNGFFSDMKEFLEMAKKGKAYLFGDGTCKINPIHGVDLAEFIVKNLETTETEMNVGGPELLVQKQIAELAFRVLGKTAKFSFMPLWTVKFSLWFLRSFTSAKTYGPLEFMMTVLTRDMIAPEYGKHYLENYFKESLQI